MDLDEKEFTNYLSTLDEVIDKAIEEATEAADSGDYNYDRVSWNESLVEGVSADRLTETVSQMFIVAADGEAGGSLYYIGRDPKAARKEYRSVAKDWRNYGLGGGDTPVCLYEYFGPVDKFDAVLAKWEAGEDLDYDINIEELGISLNDCKILASEWGCI